MRDKSLIDQRDKEIEKYFNEAYKKIEYGTSTARYNVACRETAAKFFLSIRTIQNILSKKLN